MKIYERNAPTVPEHDDEEAFYPHSDGKPLGESNAHWWSITDLTQNVWDILLSRKEDVSVHSDMFWYWERGVRRAVRAPDLMVIFGVPYVFDRLTYRSWNHGNISPALIIETASREQQQMLLGELKDDYERLGVREYFVFDWSEHYMDEPLIGFRLHEGRYERIPQNADGTLYSNELEMNMRAEGYTLRFIFPDTGERLPTPKERQKLAAQQLAEKEAALAKQKAMIAENVVSLVEKDAALMKQKAELEAQAEALAAQNAEMEKLRKLLQQAGIDASKSSP